MTQDTLAIHLELLDTERQKIFQQLSAFKNLGYLAGGTALMLQIGHRLSVDFDIFTQNSLPAGLLATLNKTFAPNPVKPEINTKEQLNVLVNGVKITFFNNPFPLFYPKISTEPIAISDIRDIASDKAYTLGRRPMWRDYVDLFFLLRDHTTLGKIIADANQRFQGNFSEKLFLEQLIYFADIEEKIVKFISTPIPEEEIKSFLVATVKKYWQGRSS